ncbi:MAG TPA: ABC transporter ATP-binding protein [Alphaproteobacteria bacterium]|nr:ABC transporter ATP-binding protein [Alphaproteobacteria bacterium]
MTSLNVDFATAGGLVRAVEGVSLDLHLGEVLGIVGESGSGKSVTCRAITRLLPLSARVSGRILLEGDDILALDENDMRGIRGEKIAMIFQNPSTHLDPLMRIGRQIGEGLRFRLGRNARQARQEAIGLLADVRISEPERRVDSYPHELSGGMKQRAMIAGALACQPRILIADEPTTALDVTVQSAILDLLRDIRHGRDLAMILVSHDLAVIAQMCDRILVMKDGRVVESGEAEEVVQRPQAAYTRILIDSQPEIMARRRSGAGHRAPLRAERPGEAMFRIENLTVEFSGRGGLLSGLLGTAAPATRAVTDLSLEIGHGETLGIVGESGSGKTTLARCLVKLVLPTAGRIWFCGHPICTMSRRDTVDYRRRVQMVFQNPYESLDPRMSAAQAIAEPLLRHRIAKGGAVGHRVRELMGMVELPVSLATRRPRQLSGGQCQRVAIARALAMEPQVLVADEITSALDVTIQSQILGLLQNLRERMGLTIILISHDLGVVRTFCHRAAVMQGGRLVETGAVEDLFGRPGQDYTRQLLAAIPRMPHTDLRGQSQSPPAAANP